MKIINCGMEMYFTMAPYAHVNIITEKKSSIDFENNILLSPFIPEIMDP